MSQEPTTNLPASTSGTFTRTCHCGATVHVVDTVEQPHEHARERIEVTTPPLDLTALRGWIEDGLRMHPEHALEVITRAEAAEKKVAAVREVVVRLVPVTERNEHIMQSTEEAHDEGHTEGWNEALTGFSKLLDGGA